MHLSLPSDPGRGFDCEAHRLTGEGDAGDSGSLTQTHERRPRFAFEVRTVLVVDDQPVMETTLRRLFSRHEVTVVFATTAARALELARETSPDLAIVDLSLGVGGSGLDLIAELRRQDPNMVIGAMSGQMHHQLADACAHAGASWSLEKPFDRDTLFATIVIHGGPVPTMLRVDLPVETMTTRYIARVLEAQDGN